MPPSPLETTVTGGLVVFGQRKEPTLLYLVLTSVIWAFSFGLIKRYLTGYDPLAVSCARLAISSLVFSPWLFRRRLPRRTVIHAMVLGAIQFGMMYTLYISAYGYLPAYAVALFTVFTPLYVVAIDDALERRWRWRHMFAAVLATAGAGVIVYRGLVGGSHAWTGILLLQMANLCFAVGQIGYRRLFAETENLVSADSRQIRIPETTLLGWMYFGAFLFTALAAVFAADRSRLLFTGSAVWALFYLGILPTAVGFYLWNKGVIRASTGVLAVCNNLKVPLAVLCSWLVFGETADYLRVLIGLSVIIAAIFLAARHDRDQHSQEPQRSTGMEQ